MQLSDYGSTLIILAVREWALDPRVIQSMEDAVLGDGCFCLHFHRWVGPLSQGPIFRIAPAFEAELLAAIRANMTGEMYRSAAMSRLLDKRRIKVENAWSDAFNRHRNAKHDALWAQVVDYRNQPEARRKEIYEQIQAQLDAELEPARKRWHAAVRRARQRVSRMNDRAMPGLVRHDWINGFMDDLNRRARDATQPERGHDDYSEIDRTAGALPPDWDAQWNHFCEQGAYRAPQLLFARMLKTAVASGHMLGQELVPESNSEDLSGFALHQSIRDRLARLWGTRPEMIMRRLRQIGSFVQSFTDQQAIALLDFAEQRAVELKQFREA